MVHISKVLNLLKCIPQNYNLVKRVYTAFNTLHYDINEDNHETGTLFSLTGARVHELRGNKKVVSIGEKESCSLINLAASICNCNCLLDILNLQYFQTVETRKKGSKTFKNLASYIKWILFDEAQQIKLFRTATTEGLNDDNWRKDIDFLRSTKYKVSTLLVYTQALIHSNIFDANVDYHQNLKIYALSEMVENNYKKPFVSYIHKDSGTYLAS